MLPQESTQSLVPHYRAVADYAVLVEFGEVAPGNAYELVRRLDTAIISNPFEGFTEAVPAFTSLLVCFDPMIIGHQAVIVEASRLIADDLPTVPRGKLREIPVCYDNEFALDLAEVASKAGLSCDEVKDAHLRGSYNVVMYGFAPGYAYMQGVSESIQLPRKPNAVRDVPAGSLLIAGPQCLVSTLTMPTGWWIIGRSPCMALSNTASCQFFLDVGDRVKFRPINREEFERIEKGNSYG